MGDHEHHSDHEHAHTSQLGYLGVLGALFLGTVLTWKARDLGHAQHWSLGFSAFVALAIATIKASLVVYFFMHVRESAKIIKLTAVGGFLFLSLLFIFVFGDYTTRRELPSGLSWQARDAGLTESTQALGGPTKTGQFGIFSVMAHAVPAKTDSPAEPASSAAPASHK